MVVGGDVVYDELQWTAICSALTRALRADGIALLADPGWVEKSKMRATFRQSGFAVSKKQWGYDGRLGRSRVSATRVSTSIASGAMG